MTHLDQQPKESPFKTTADVESGVAMLNKILHRKEDLAPETFAQYFEKLHAHAAWSGIEALADLADRIWTQLDDARGQDTLCNDVRHELKKSLVTYKFLIHRKAAREESDEALAS